jgi:pimeloyl-ACP methyl ester carboxylesterase
MPAVSERVRALVLVDPSIVLTTSALLRLVYHRPLITAIVRWTPGWLFRLIVDGTSISMGHSNGGVHNLPERIRAQTTLDYIRTAPGVYNLPNSMTDLTPCLPEIKLPSLAVWGTRDTTLPPSSFADLVSALPNVTVQTLPAGHVPHQSHAQEFNRFVIEFLQTL